MVLDVFSKKGGIGESEAVTDLFDTQIGLAQVVADVLQHLLRNPLVGGLARVFLAEDREVFGRYT